MKNPKNVLRRHGKTLLLAAAAALLVGTPAAVCLAQTDAAPVDPPPPSAVADTAFTIAVLPDTQRDIHQDDQVESAVGIDRFNNRLTYLRDHKAEFNLQLVMQVGDLQDWDTPLHMQYERASAGLKTLDDAHIPYVLCIGNHDTAAVAPGGSAFDPAVLPGYSAIEYVRKTETWNHYYPPARFPGMVTYEPAKTDNAYRTFTLGKLKFLIINYEIWPRLGVIDWMINVVASHPDHNVVLLTHSYLTDKSNIFQKNGGYGANTPQFIYDKLVSKYPNVKLIFCGHTGNSGYRVDEGVGGNKVYSFLDCYHDTTNNWMRLLTIDPVKKTISTKVYSPFTNKTRPEPTANVDIADVSWIE